MDINEFITAFADQLDETTAQELTSETNFRELDDWSSMAALSVIAMIDDEFNIQIKADEMRKTSHIQELFDLVQSKKSIDE